jgi:hypothetical protein
MSKGRTDTPPAPEETIAGVASTAGQHFYVVRTPDAAFIEVFLTSTSS